MNRLGFYLLKITAHLFSIVMNIRIKNFGDNISNNVCHNFLSIKKSARRRFIQVSPFSEIIEWQKGCTRKSAGSNSSKKLPMKSSKDKTVPFRNANFFKFLKIDKFKIASFVNFLVDNQIVAIVYLLVSAPVDIRSALVLKEKPLSLFLIAFWLSSILSSPKGSFPSPGLKLYLRAFFLFCRQHDSCLLQKTLLHHHLQICTR